MVTDSLTALRVSLAGTLVALEPLEPRHEAGLWEAAKESDWTWMPIDAGGSRAAFDRLFRWLLADPEPAVALAILQRESGRVIGSSRFHEIRPEHRRLEIGMTWYARSAWRSGANVDAKLQMLEHAFERLDYRRVEFKTDARNERSRRALEALPAQFEGVFRKHMLVRDGATRDSAYYSIIDDEWPSVRANLERRIREHNA
jgi:RimJ/RimL family protein N-acetyltransferase